MLKVANNALELLEYICSSHQREFSVTGLSTQFEMNKTTVYRILRVLTDRGYLRQDKKTGHYMLDIKLLEMGAQVTNKVGLLEVVSPYMEQLAKDTEETVNLAVMNNEKVVYVHKVNSIHFLRTDLRVGTSVPVYCSALGKAMLARLSQDELEAVLPPGKLVAYTPNTVTNTNALSGELEKIRETGYAVDNEEYIPGVICVAAPILNRGGKAIAAVSVAGPGLRMTAEKISTVGKLINDYTKEISSRYGKG